MADESRWDEDERRRRWEEERYRRGAQYGREGQYGSESQYAREGWREMTGRDRGGDWRGGGGFGESRPRSYGGYGQGRGPAYGYGYGGGYSGGSYSAEGWRGPDYRGGYSEQFGGSGREYGPGDEYRGGRSGREQGYVGFGADQGFWRSDTAAAGMGGTGPVPEYGDPMRGGRHRGRGPRGYTRSDERIREDVCDRLSDDPMIDASDIEIQVSGGEVTLSGHVHSRGLKRRAEDLADDISGVRHVQNNLRIRGWDSGSGQPGDASSTATLSGRPARKV